MKKYFITGLVILLPVALTLAIVAFVFNLLTVPFLGIVKTIFGSLALNDTLQVFIAQILILLCLFLFTILLGAVTRWFFVRWLLKFAEYIVHKIPLVSSIYRTCQDVISTMFASSSNSFKQVVLVKFPSPGTLSVGLVTRDDLPNLTGDPNQQHVAVFVPTTPNPTSGFLILFKQEDLIYLDIKVEDAFKYIISCGLITPESFRATNLHHEEGIQS